MNYNHLRELSTNERRTGGRRGGEEEEFDAVARTKTLEPMMRPGTEKVKVGRFGFK